MKIKAFIKVSERGIIIIFSSIIQLCLSAMNDSGCSIEADLKLKIDLATFNTQCIFCPQIYFTSLVLHFGGQDGCLNKQNSSKNSTF